jgi:hypothetical protein
VTGETIEAGFTIHGSEQEGRIHVATSLGDEEDVRSLLVEVRKFLSEKEDVFFPRIAGIVERSVTDPELVKANRDNRAVWKRALNVGSMGLVVDEKSYPPYRCFDLVVNGGLFHDDAGKAAEFAGLAPMFQQFALYSVNNLLIRVLRIVHAERELIKEAYARGAVHVAPPPTT